LQVKHHNPALHPAQNHWVQNEKKRRSPIRLSEEECDVFVVSGATAVGYLCGLQSKTWASNGLCTNLPHVQAGLIQAQGISPATRSWQ
jgi:hypothetical protein